MKKFENIDDLAKAVGQVAGLTLELSKGHSLHMAAHTHHESQAAHYKAAHDAMDDGHEQKANIGKAHEHHTFKAAHHKAMAEAHKALEAKANSLAAAFGTEPELAKTTSAAAPAPTTPSGVVEGLVANMAGDLNTLAKDMIANDPAVKEMVRKTIADAISSALGNKIVPDNVRATIPSNPPDEVLSHLKLVPRGSTGASLEKAAVDPDMEDAFAI